MDVILISEVFSSGENQLVLMRSLRTCLAQAEAGLSACSGGHLGQSYAQNLFPVGGRPVWGVMLWGEVVAHHTHIIVPQTLLQCVHL